MSPHQKKLSFAVAKTSRQKEVFSKTVQTSDRVTRSSKSKPKSLVTQYQAPDLEEITPEFTNHVLKSELEPVSLTLYEEAEKLQNAFSFHVPDFLPGRQKQINELSELLRNCISFQQSVSVYMYGSYGTGKTATVTSLCANSHIKKHFKIIFINCMDMKSLNQLYTEISKNLDKKPKQRGKQINIDKIAQSIDSQQKSILLILDEFDALKCRRNSELSLYSLFELRLKLKNRQLALICIGNCLTLIEERLPLLMNYVDIMPELMAFEAYDRNAVKEILLERVNSVPQNHIVFTEQAIELLAAKTANAGDIRQTFFIASAAVTQAIKNSSEGEVCKITPFSVMEIYNRSRKDESLKNFTTSQKIILCCVVRILNEDCSSKLTVEQIFREVTKVLEEKNLNKLPSYEFIELCGRIEMQGVFTIKRKQKTAIDWCHKIEMNWCIADLTEELRKMPLFGSLLS